MHRVFPSVNGSNVGQDNMDMGPVMKITKQEYDCGLMTSIRGRHQGEQGTKTFLFNGSRV